jgi:tetratricopeptide (TPR) repeat protein
VHANSAARFEQSYRTIASAVKLPGVNEPKTDILGLVFRWLESDNSGDWLMILDNADDASVFFNPRGAEVPQMGDRMLYTKALSAYLPQHSRGSVLVTSRNRDAAFRLVGRDDRIVKVEPMEEAEIKALLRKKLLNDQSKEEDWSGLVSALEFLPLAITQAAAYIAMKAPRMTISKYSEYFRRNERDQVSLLSKDGGDLRRDPEVPNAVVITWRISFEQIKKQDAPAADLLSRMCVLERQGMPRYLLSNSDRDGLDFEDAIGTLLAFSFVAMDKDKNVFQMHPLVQLSTRKWLEVNGEIGIRREEVLGLLSKKFPSGEHANWKTCEALAPHAQVLLRCEFTSEKCGLQRARILHNSAWYSLARGNYEEAKCKAREAVKIKEELLGADNANTLTSLNLLASVLCGQGQWKEAEEMEMQVMEIRKRMLGEEHPNTLTSMGNLASTYRNQGRWKEAEKLEVQVMETSKRVLGEEHPDTLATMGNLATIYGNQGRWKEAEKLEMQVMETIKRVLGDEHPSTLTIMNNLAGTYGNRGRWKEAEELGIQVMKKRKRVLGDEHPDTLTSMGNLASAYRNQGWWKEAEELEIQVMKTRKRVLGDEHPSTLTSMVNLAYTWKSQSRDSDALDMLKQAEAKRRKVLGIDHPRTKASIQALYKWQTET